MTTMLALSWSFCATPSVQLTWLGGKSVAGKSRGDLKNSSFVDSHRVIDTGSAALDTFARIKSSGIQPSCNSAPSFPQRPLTPDSSSASGAAEKYSGRQNVAGGGKKSKTSENLQKQKITKKSPQVASSVMRSTSPAMEGEIMPISLTPSHATSSVFLPTAPVSIPFPECLRLEGDRVSTSSVFRMAMTCCVVAQWIKIAGALSMWASRLRLKFFESPLVYKNSTKSFKLGRIGVFWDLENCPVPSGGDVPIIVDKIRTIANAFGEIQCFRAYGKLEYLSRQALPFLNKDIELCPVPDGKESADKAIILDAILFAFDHKPCPENSMSSGSESDSERDGVVVVTGDRGFAALLKELGRRGLTTVVIGNAHQALPSILGQSADYSLGWDDMMINDDFDDGFFDKASGKLDSVEDDCEDLEGETKRMDLQDSSVVDCYQLDSRGSELLCITVSEKPNPLVHGLPKVVSEGSIEEARADGTVMKQQLKGVEFNSCELVNSNKLTAQIGGRIRVLRHLRCEVAAVSEKHCKKGKCVDFEEFLRLYEMEMGHMLVPGHYGFGSLKLLLESMPDLVSLREISKDNPDLEIFTFYPKGRNSYGKINYSRDDLRCILYEMLHTQWPLGLKKELLSSEHLKITGRPLVLVTYEFLKTSDVFGSMRDMLYVDSRSKQLYLVDGAQEPAGYNTLAQNRWT